MSDNQASEKRMPAYLKDLRPDPDAGREIDFQSPGERAPAVEPRFNRRRWIGLSLGILLAFFIYFIMPAEVPHNAKLTAATAVLMGAWWMTEAIPLPGTALMPLIIFPTLGEEIEIKDVGGAYGNDVIFLFMGGFLLALAMQRWNLHRRIALLVVRAMGPKPGGMIAGFMIATGFLSMWVSNTATAVMMLPIGISVLILVARLTAGKDPAQLAAEEAAASAAAQTEVDEDGDTKVSAVEAITKSNFGTALMLGIAYAASVGSLGTLIGTPPNTLLAGYMADSHGVEIGFGQWMLVGVPLAVLMTFAVWFILTKVLFKPEIKEIPGGRELMNEELAKLGPMSTGEKLVGTIFILAALAWVFIPVFWKGLISDAGIAMVVGFLLFVLPGGANRGVRLLDWESAVKLPWGVLLLFGGGLALSAQFSGSGLTAWIGESVSGLAGVPTIIMVALFATGILFLTELTSNTATAATFLPVAGGVAIGIGADPMLLAIPVALAATCAFMLPVATPPNAIAYGSGYVTIGQMVRGGLWLNLIGIVLVTLVTMTLAVWVFGLAL